MCRTVGFGTIYYNIPIVVVKYYFINYYDMRKM